MSSSLTEEILNRYKNGFSEDLEESARTRLSPRIRLSSDEIHSLNKERASKKGPGISHNSKLSFYQSNHHETGKTKTFAYKDGDESSQKKAYNLAKEHAGINESSKADLAAMAAAAMKSGVEVKKIDAGTVSNIAHNAWKKAAMGGEKVAGKGTIKVDPKTLAPSATFKGTNAGLRRKVAKEDVEMETQQFVEAKDKEGYTLWPNQKKKSFYQAPKDKDGKTDIQKWAEKKKLEKSEQK